MINDAGIALIKLAEGLRLDAYTDVRGIWTIGYGHAYSLPQPCIAVGWPAQPDSIPQDLADWLLYYDIAWAEEDVRQAAGSATEDQVGAMTSLCYNIGGTAFRSSTVLREHRAGNFPAAANGFMLWDRAHINGMLEEVPGLKARREKEQALYLHLTPAE